MSQDAGGPNFRPMLSEIKNDNQTVGDVVVLALSLFGSEAATAVAFCATDSYLDADEQEYRKLAKVFRRLSN